MTMIAGPFIGAILMSLIFLGSMIAMIILLGIWTFHDATRRGMDGMMWAMIAVLVPGLIGAIVYLCVRNKEVASDGADDDLLRKQKNRSIGFFVSLGIAIFSVIMMVVLFAMGTARAVDKAVDTVSELSGLLNGQIVENLDDIDALLGQAGMKLRVDGDDIYIKDTQGNELVHVNGKTNQVDFDSSAIKNTLEQYGIDYDESMSDEELQETMQEVLEELEHVENVDDLNQLKEKIQSEIDDNQNK